MIWQNSWNSWIFRTENTQISILGNKLQTDVKYSILYVCICSHTESSLHHLIFQKLAKQISVVINSSVLILPEYPLAMYISMYPLAMYILPTEPQNKSIGLSKILKMFPQAYLSLKPRFMINLSTSLNYFFGIQGIYYWQALHFGYSGSWLYEVVLFLLLRNWGNV